MNISVDSSNCFCTAQRKWYSHETSCTNMFCRCERRNSIFIFPKPHVTIPTNFLRFVILFVFFSLLNLGLSLAYTLRTLPTEIQTKKGTLGQKFELSTNYFPLKKRPNWRLFLYCVDMLPEVDYTKVRWSYNTCNIYVSEVIWFGSMWPCLHHWICIRLIGYYLVF